MDTVLQAIFNVSLLRQEAASKDVMEAKPEVPPHVAEDPESVNQVGDMTRELPLEEALDRAMFDNPQTEKSDQSDAMSSGPNCYLQSVPSTATTVAGAEGLVLEPLAEDREVDAESL